MAAAVSGFVGTPEPGTGADPGSAPAGGAAVGGRELPDGFAGPGSSSAPPFAGRERGAGSWFSISPVQPLTKTASAARPRPAAAAAAAAADCLILGGRRASMMEEYPRFEKRLRSTKSFRPPCHTVADHPTLREIEEQDTGRVGDLDIDMYEPPLKGVGRDAVISQSSRAERIDQRHPRVRRQTAKL